MTMAARHSRSVCCVLAACGLVQQGLSPVHSTQILSRTLAPYGETTVLACRTKTKCNDALVVKSKIHWYDTSAAVGAATPHQNAGASRSSMPHDKAAASLSSAPSATAAFGWCQRGRPPRPGCRQRTAGCSCWQSGWRRPVCIITPHYSWAGAGCADESSA